MKYDNEHLKKKRKEKYGDINLMAYGIGLSHITCLKIEHGESVNLCSLERYCKAIGVKELTIKF